MFVSDSADKVTSGKTGEKQAALNKSVVGGN